MFEYSDFEFHYYTVNYKKIEKATSYSVQITHASAAFTTDKYIGFKLSWSIIDDDNSYSHNRFKQNDYHKMEMNNFYNTFSLISEGK